MTEEPIDNTEDDASRRQYLRYTGGLLGSGAAMTISGCNALSGDGGGDGGDGGDSGGDGGDGDGGGDFGPPVEVELNFWSGAAFETKIQQDSLDVIRQNLADLGMDVEVNGRAVPTSAKTAYQDIRDGMFSASMWAHGPDPSRLDPDEFIIRRATHRAGRHGNSNVANWANCEYTQYAVGQRNAESEEQRREWVNEAERIAGNDKAQFTLSPLPVFGAYRDNVDANSIGNVGIDQLNPAFFMDSTPTDKDTLVADIRPGIIETLNPLTSNNIGGFLPLMRFVWSPVVAHSVDLELEPLLAEEVPQYSNNGTTLTINLRDGLTFHNGDPLTAEDVKFTYEFAKENRAKFPSGGGNPRFTEVNAVDETTVELSFDSPALTIRDVWMTRWGILHEESMAQAGAVENPDGWQPNPDRLVGSGPMQIQLHESGQSIGYEPSDHDHPLRNPDHSILFRAFEGATSAARAIIEGNIDVVVNITGGNLSTIEEQADNVTTNVTQTHSPFMMYPMAHVAPMKFEGVRDAVGTAIDRQSINEIAFNGNNEMITHCTMFPEAHPWRPPDDVLYEFTDDPSGDIDAARQKLKDAGFEYDDNDTLRYPQDADLDPLWPAGESPTKEYGFPCVEREGDTLVYVGPDTPE